jgi:hypothetical protein
MQGKLVMNKNIDGDNFISIDGLTPGFYNIAVSDGVNYTRTKLIVE